MAKRRRDKFGGGLGESEGLAFEGFADASQTAIDGGSDTHFGFMIGNAHKGIVDGGACLRLARYERSKPHFGQIKSGGTFQGG